VCLRNVGRFSILELSNFVKSFYESSIVKTPKVIVFIILQRFLNFSENCNLRKPEEGGSLWYARN